MPYPMTISMVVNALYNIVDSFFVSQISDKTMTALYPLFTVQNFANFAVVEFAISYPVRGP